jgi:hypothetical protein
MCQNLWFDVVSSYNLGFNQRIDLNIVMNCNCLKCYNGADFMASQGAEEMANIEIWKKSRVLIINIKLCAMFLGFHANAHFHYFKFFKLNTCFLSFQ